jgi:hypothetical protein
MTTGRAETNATEMDAIFYLAFNLSLPVGSNIKI